MTTKLEQLADEVIRTDFLVLGGGLVGCMAALRARQDKNIYGETRYSREKIE